MIICEDIERFLKHSARYASLGMAIVEVSDLELAHDEFILEVNRRDPIFARRLSAKLPRQFREKANFLIDSIICSHTLKQVPIFSNGSLNLQWLQLQLDEIYDIKAVIAHGAISLTESHVDGHIYRLSRVTSSEKGWWGTAHIEVGSSFLADLCETCRVLKHYLKSLRLALLGEYSWDQSYKKEVEMIANRSFFLELVDYGMAAPDPFLEQFRRPG